MRGTFTMSDGKISGNTADRGGGVFIYNSGGGAGGTFIMSGGEISGNTVNGGDGNYGGGVYVGSSETFRIVAGTIYGSGEGVLSNTADEGATVYLGEGTAQYGTFNGETWWNSNGDLSTTDDTIKVVNGIMMGAIGSIIAPQWSDGRPVSLVTPSVGFENLTAQGWQVSDDGSSGWANFTSSTADMSCNGKYLRYYAAISDGSTLYSNVVQITVYASDFHPNQVTIDMYDSHGDGWDGNGALRITVNGTQIATNIKVSTTDQNTPSWQKSSNTYTFPVKAGDVVQLYWVLGSFQGENSFIAYYTNMPPSPMFTANNNDSWSGSNALVFRLHGTMKYITGGTLLGSFTVP